MLEISTVEQRIANSVARPRLQTILLGSFVGAALALTHYLAAILHAVGPNDPTAFALSVATLAVVAAIACYLPACRAARVDPIVPSGKSSGFAATRNGSRAHKMIGRALGYFETDKTNKAALAANSVS